MEPRISKENYYLNIAETVLERATCLRRVFGAIIVKNDEIISTGYNGAPRGRRNCVDMGFCTREAMRVPRGERYELCRSVEDLCFKDDLFNNWPKEENTQVYVTIDRPQEGWEGHVGFVPDYIKEIAPNPQIAIICGPPVMIKFSLPALTGLGFQSDDVITTLELRMKCGIGKCGRCNIGHKYVCLDGPVFTLTQLNEMPNEY